MIGPRCAASGGVCGGGCYVFFRLRVGLTRELRSRTPHVPVRTRPIRTPRPTSPVSLPSEATPRTPPPHHATIHTRPRDLQSCDCFYPVVVVYVYRLCHILLFFFIFVEPTPLPPRAEDHLCL